LPSSFRVRCDRLGLPFGARRAEGEAYLPHPLRVSRLLAPRGFWSDGTKLLREIQLILAAPTQHFQRPFEPRCWCRALCSGSTVAPYSSSRSRRYSNEKTETRFAAKADRPCCNCYSAGDSAPGVVWLASSGTREAPLRSATTAAFGNCCRKGGVCNTGRHSEEDGRLLSDRQKTRNGRRVWFLTESYRSRRSGNLQRTSVWAPWSSPLAGFSR